jgi:hypothetical protein
MLARKKQTNHAIWRGKRSDVKHLIMATEEGPEVYRAHPSWLTLGASRRSPRYLSQFRMLRPPAIGWIQHKASRKAAEKRSSFLIGGNDTSGDIDSHQGSACMSVGFNECARNFRGILESPFAESLTNNFGLPGQCSWMHRNFTLPARNVKCSNRLLSH